MLTPQPDPQQELQPDVQRDLALPGAARGVEPEVADGYPLGRPRFYIPVVKPYVTYGLVAANLIVFVFAFAYGLVQYGVWTGSQDMRVLVALGAKVNELVTLGQAWRLFTAMFLHIGPLHLLFNLYALYAIGTLIEGYFGHVRYALIYLLGGLLGSVASYAFTSAPSAGASGGIFAITGATAVYFFRYRENFGTRGRAVLQNMLLIIVVNLAFGFAGSGVDNWGHTGGLFGGALVAWGLLPRYRVPAVVRYGDQPMEVIHRPVLEVAWVAGCCVLLAAFFLWARSTQIDAVLQLLQY
jgi:membrane associated rhomboid family serine protease